jgi:hypothetical protein
MAKGGARPGAGRPKGSTTRPQLRNFYSKAELAEFVASLKARALTDSQLAKIVAEQLFGKAPQPLSGDPDNPIAFKAIEISFKEK